MLNSFKFFGIFTFAILIGFTFISCNDSNPKPCTSHNWDWASDAIDATCTEKSKDTTTCKNVGCTATDQRDGSMDALGHEGVNFIPSTCQTVGNTGEGTCTRCSEFITSEEIPIDLDAHDWDDWVLNAIEATCTEKSKDIKNCLNIGCSEKDERDGSINALGHECVGAVQPTCQTVGNTGIGQCTRCFEDVSGDEIPIDPTAHDWEWTTNAIAATCMAASRDTATCNNIGCIQTNERTGSNPINPTAHNWNWTANTIAATCMAASKDTATCNHAGCIATNERTGSNPINPSAHNWNWTANTIAATCMAASKDTATCNNAGCIVTNERTGSNAALGHNWDWTNYTSGSGLRICQRGGGCTVTAGIGDTGPGGGIIFYVADGGGLPARNPFTVPASPGGYSPAWTSYTASYLEAAPANVVGTQQWANRTGDLIPNLSPNNADETDWRIGRGRLNTALIIADGNAKVYTTPAASACAALRTGAKDDWFLPSRNELNALAQIRGLYGIPNTGWYWSSSQNGSEFAWLQDFNNGNQTNNFKNNNSNNVRAIRAF